MARYLLKTFGCKANMHDSQVLEHSLSAQGWESAREQDSESVDLCIINSCAVTDEAEKQARKMARRLAKENPGAAIVVTGCAAEINPRGFKDAHFIVGNQNKADFAKLVGTGGQPDLPGLPGQTQILGTLTPYATMLSRHPMDREWPAISNAFLSAKAEESFFSDKTRAFLKVQEGCNDFCTYCVIPYGRGPSRSLEIPDVIKQITELCEKGLKEVVLTGTNIGDYGSDWGGKPQFEKLVERILAETPLLRLRLSSLDPSEITPKLLRLMEQDPRLCPHFHVSLQSPHSKILKLMKRKYDFEQVESVLGAIAALRAPHLPAGGVFVGMDVITGFPGETDADFEWGFEQLARLPWQRLHVFPYSERQGTAATRLPGSVKQEVRKARAQKLNGLSMERLTQFYRSLQSEFSESQSVRGPKLLRGVLLERAGKSGWAAGYTSNYIRVMLSGMPSARNDLISVQPMDVMIDPSGRDVALVCRPIG